MPYNATHALLLKQVCCLSLSFAIFIACELQALQANISASCLCAKEWEKTAARVNNFEMQKSAHLFVDVVSNVLGLNFL